MLVVSCPKCRQSYSLPPEKEGLRVRCKCGRQFVAQANRARGGRPKDSAGLFVGLILGGLALMVVLILALSKGNDPPKTDETDEPTAKVVRDAGKSVDLNRDGIDPVQVIPVADAFLAALIANGPFDALRPSIAFDSWYENERKRLTLLSQDVPPWASLPDDEKKRFEAELIGRLTDPPGSDGEWNFAGCTKMDPQPKLYREFGYPREENHGTAHYRLKTAENKLRNTYVDMVYHPTQHAWMVEGLRRTFAGTDPEPIPHPTEVKLLASGRAVTAGSSGTRKVDAGDAFEKGLSEKGEFIRTEDGAAGRVALPRPIPHFPDTTADEKRRMSELLALMTTDDSRDGVHALNELLTFKRKAVPVLLTSLFENYQKSLDAIAKKDKFADAHLATEAVIIALTKLKEQVYQDTPKEGSTSNIDWSRRAVEGGDLDVAGKQLRTVVAFWFGWWSKFESVEPQGELQGIGRKRPGGIRR